LLRQSLGSWTGSGASASMALFVVFAVMAAFYVGPCEERQSGGPLCGGNQYPK
jgi:hypothetical protein